MSHNLIFDTGQPDRTERWTLLPPLITASLLALGLFLLGPQRLALAQVLEAILLTVSSLVIFVLTITYRHLLGHDYFLALGVGQLFAGLVMFSTDLTLWGSGPLPDEPLALQRLLYLVSEILTVLAFVVAPTFLKRPLPLVAAVGVYAAITSGLLALAFSGALDPQSPIAPAVLLLGLAPAAGQLLRARERFEPLTWGALLGAILANAVNAVLFTAVADTYHPVRYLALGLSLVAQVLIFRGIAFAGLRRLQALHEQALLATRQALASTQKALDKAVTNEAQITQALAESERRFRAILEGTDLYALILDYEGRLTFCNNALLQATGWSREEVIGQNYFTLFAPHDPERRHQFMALRDVQEIPSELRHMAADIATRDGQRRIVHWNNFLLRGPDGQPVGLAALGTDLTETVKTQEAQQAQFERLLLLNELTRAMLSRDDLESMLTSMLDSLTAILPAELGVVLTAQDDQLHLAACVEGDDRASACAALAEASPLSLQGTGLLPCARGDIVHQTNLLEEGQPPYQRLLHQAGMRATLALPLQTADGMVGILSLARSDPVGFSEEEISTLRQIADQATLAIRHVRLYQELHTVYQDLYQAQQDAMAAERLRALGEMASGIAHDINNAISPAAVYASMLARDPALNDRVRQRLQIIQTAIDDVGETVARLREFYRHREPTEALEPVDLNEAVRHVVDLTRPRWADQAQVHGAVIEVHTELAEDIPPVQGVPHEIREALTNVVLNAVDAMPNGGTLTLRTYRGASGDIRLEVQDTGVGMDQETLVRAPQPFFTTKGDKGTGLGLSVVSGIMKRHNGRLEIASTPGQGTRVRFIFPAPRPIEETEEEQPVQAPVGPLRILVIDDQTPVRIALQDMLESLGHIVQSAPGGRAGLQAFQEAQAQGKPFDVVITDLGMPEINGSEVLGTVKARSPQTPVIILSGWGKHPANDQDKVSMPQADAVLTKPPRLETLSATLARVMRGRRTEESRGDESASNLPQV